MVAAPEPQPATARRRTVLTAAAWTIPVVAGAATAPAAAASGQPQVCTSTVTAVFTPTFDYDFSTYPVTTTATLPATGEPAHTYSVTLVSMPSPDTDVLGYNYGTPHSFNMTQTASGWAGHSDSAGDDDVITAAGPASALVLNQSAAFDEDPVTGAHTPTTPRSDSQSIEFQFRIDGVPVTPQWIEIDIAGLSSESSSGWRGDFWDAVAFSVAPAAITTSAGTAPGAGAGTAASPFGRATGDEPAQSASGPIDTFLIQGATGSSVTMDFTQKDGRQGFHFAAIAGIRFCV